MVRRNMKRMTGPTRRALWARVAVASALAATLALSGCTVAAYDSDDADTAASSTEGAATSEEEVDWASLIDIAGMDFSYSDRDKDATYDEASATKIALAGQSASVEGDGASAEGATVTISAAGTYVLTGELSAGSVVVNASKEDKVQLVLDGASIRNETGPALNIQQADKVFVTLAADTQNALADGASYALEEGEDEPNAALYSKDDLTINGTGALTVEGNYRHGVNSKDDLVITGGAVTVTAKEDALLGKDCVKVADGSFALTAGGDGVKSSNDEDPTRGFVSIDGGAFAVEAGDEGFQAATYLRLAGGEAQVKAADHALRSDIEAALIDGVYTVEAGGKGMNAETKFTQDGGALTVTGCDEGIEAQEVIINDGVVDITASDDGINAAKAERASNDNETAETAGDAQDATAASGTSDGAGTADGATGSGDASGADGDAQRTEGQDGQTPPELPEGAQPGEGQTPPELPEGVDPGQRPEGQEGQAPEPPAGQQGERPEMPEGMEPGQRPEGDGQGGPGGMRGGAGGPVADNASEQCLIQINGGSVSIDAGGDGLDSNGYVEVTGGTVLANGSAGGGDSALDYEYGATITGGTVLLAGSTGMAETFSEGSTQPFALVEVAGSANSTLVLTDEAGQELASYTVPKAFQCVVVSAPALTEGATGALTVDGATTDFTVSTTPTGGMGAMGGRGGGPHGERPDGNSASEANGSQDGTSEAPQQRGAGQASPQAEVTA